MKATLIKDFGIDDSQLPITRHRKFYSLDEPLEGYKYVIVSVVDSSIKWISKEARIYPANEDGELTLWEEIGETSKGVLTHEQALKNAGYDV